MIFCSLILSAFCAVISGAPPYTGSTLLHYYYNRCLLNRLLDFEYNIVGAQAEELFMHEEKVRQKKIHELQTKANQSKSTADPSTSKQQKPISPFCLPVPLLSRQWSSKSFTANTSEDQLKAALDKVITDELCMNMDRLAMEVACKSAFQNSFFQKQKVKYNNGVAPMCIPKNVVRKFPEVSQYEKGHQETTENKGIPQTDDKEKLKGTQEDERIREVADTENRPEVKTNEKIQDRKMFPRTTLVCPSVIPNPLTGTDITFAWYFSATEQYDPKTNHLVFYVFEPVFRNPKSTAGLLYIDLTLVTVEMVLINKRDPMAKIVKTEKENLKNKAPEDEESMNKKRKNRVQRNEEPENEEQKNETPNNGEPQNMEIEREEPENKELKRMKDQ